MTTVIKQRPTDLPLQPACDALGLQRSVWYSWQKRRQQPVTRRERRQGHQPRALSQQEREAVLSELNSERFADQTPEQVYHSLLDEGVYLCSLRTMHRVLKANSLCGDRRLQARRSPQPIPRLMADAPNRVWTWDVTKLPLQIRGIYLSLYVVMDLYSRYIVAWMLSHKENSALAQQLVREAHDRYEIDQAMTLHQDRGAPMIAHGFLDLLGELAMTASHSRPRVSNDNPMSESQFKTMKYQPDYPRRFESASHAQQWCDDYVRWYNFSHHHSALAGFTPAQVFSGEHKTLATTRQAALDQQYRLHPERFVKGPPRVKMPPEAVYINPLMDEHGEIEIDAAVNFPTLSRCIERMEKEVN